MSDGKLWSLPHRTGQYKTMTWLAKKEKIKNYCVNIFLILTGPVLNPSYKKNVRSETAKEQGHKAVKKSW